MVRIKRVYEDASPEDGHRFLVDRLWPRGLSKETAHLERWVRDLAPSTDLRRWFGHDPQKWQEFRTRYLQELVQQGTLLDELRELARRETVTLLYAAHDREHNNAAVLQELLQR